jgi:hypothetical protein
MGTQPEPRTPVAAHRVATLAVGVLRLAIRRRVGGRGPPGHLEVEPEVTAVLGRRRRGRSQPGWHAGLVRGWARLHPTLSAHWRAASPQPGHSPTVPPAPSRARILPEIKHYDLAGSRHARPP